MNYKIGNGFDIHKVNKDKPLILGGYRVSSKNGLESESDGDVVIHALFDSIVGALGLGDIGDYFPPQKNNVKDSKEILLKGKDLLSEFDYHIANIDITILIEEPKIHHVLSKIKESIANILDIISAKVNVKASSFEGFDSVGKKIAIACQCSVLLEKGEK